VIIRSKCPPTVIEDSDEDDIAVPKKKPKQKKNKNDAAKVEAVDSVGVTLYISNVKPFSTSSFNWALIRAFNVTEDVTTAESTFLNENVLASFFIFFALNTLNKHL
jgi:hypothetical protein